MNSLPLLLELFTEELPPKSLKRLGESLSQSIYEGLKRAQLLSASSTCQSFASPRRLAVLISDVLDQASDYPVREKLLPLSIAFDEQGKPSQALTKKLASLGHSDTPLNQLERSGEGKNEALYLNTIAKGARLESTLQEALVDAIHHLPIAKMMHYQIQTQSGAIEEVQFARPVHRIIVLHGSKTLAIHALGIDASNQTEGHRFLSPGIITISDAQQYEPRLEAAKVIPSFTKRRAYIESGLQKAANGLRVLMPDALLDEVTALVEYPAIYTCEFDPEFLEVPQECLILTMQTNQKYFALINQDGKLSNRFLIVSNIQTDQPESIISGNERVIRPRLADARFFYLQDQKRTLESRIPDLAKVIYHNQLGNQLQRSERVRALASEIASSLNRAGFELNPQEVDRASQLAKADLLTDMVGEFPELQGVMGRYYALANHEAPDVAVACYEHYLPRFAGDFLPQTLVGTVLAIADKLETIVGIWGVGLAPTGDKDPYALRRHALGICRLLLEKNLPLNLKQLIGLAKQQFSNLVLKVEVDEEVIYQFILDRLKAYLKDQAVDGATFSPLEIDAVLSTHPQKLNDLIARLVAIRSFNQLPQATALAGANKRISNILKKVDGKVSAEINPSLLTIAAEKNLYTALTQLQPRLDQKLQAQQLIDLLQDLVSLSDPVDQFFADVMVMDENIELRNNRLALLQRLHQQMNLVADIGKLA
ncbi:glycine--tRNA ligase subunit beta [Polynucleobacter sp. HIN9]|uniref:glycine--tRNA ligase subunit beta n=1 Tax=Polynucleobacter sp. HIN9 TaxID=3047868 RepID=UPI0025725244|nr:glycine--tRNA ligase subunit beta [Polynucleobacter sp. HIN9]BEI41660.1 glycine--tRNA ligase subunit beta [Polynucleobacter sp. HIN9]